MKVFEVMQKEVATVTPDTPLSTVGRIIFGSQMSGVPVVEKGKLVGMIVEKDIISLLYPSQKEYMEDVVHARDFEAMEEKIPDLSGLFARDFMSKNPVTISLDVPLLRAGALMLSRRLRRLPVVNRQGRLVGVISQGDIFRFLVREKLPAIKRKADLFSRFAKYYDLSFGWPQRLKKEIPFLVKYLKKGEAKTVLDAGCGTGQHALSLAKLGFKVLGVDQNKEMIKVAREKLVKEKEKVKKNVEFLLLAIEKLPQVKRKFDALLCLGNMLPFIHHYKEELAKCSELLNEKGVLILHLHNYEKIFALRQRFLSYDFRPQKEGVEAKEYCFLRFYDFRPDGFLNFNIETLAFDGRRWRSYGVETAVQRPIFKKDLAVLLPKLGFTKTKFFGDFTGEEYDKKKSPFLIVVATF